MYYEKIEQEEYNSHIFMKKVRRHRNIGISILIVQIMGGIYLLFNTWQYPLVYVSIDYKIRKDKKMSNDFRFEIQMEDLFLKHLKIVQQDFDLPEEVQEQIAEARAMKELDREEELPSYTDLYEEVEDDPFNCHTAHLEEVDYHKRKYLEEYRELEKEIEENDR